MPRLTQAVPRYSKHRASGQAVVSLSGQDFYLGPHGTKSSKLEYDRVIAEWLARGRRPLTSDGGQYVLTNVELIVRYKRYAEGYYRKNGKITDEVSCLLSALRFVKEMYGREPVYEFGPLKLQAIQQAMIRANWSRRTINQQIGRIIRMYSWGVSQELVRTDIAAALREVKGLHKGRTSARESGPVLPVDDATVNATLDYLPPVVADMARLQRYTGCRPDEVCMVRPCDIDVSGPVWEYRPESHKTQHRGRERVIFIGPKGQGVLRPYLLREKESYCFSPRDAERSRRAELHDQRITPLEYGNRPGTNRKRRPERSAGDRYTSDSYRRAVCRACELAFNMPEQLRAIPKQASADEKASLRKQAAAWRASHVWSPNQLRHSAATEIRARFGLEAAQVALGHAAADVTQVYAERDMQKAVAVMLQVG